MTQTDLIPKEKRTAVFSDCKRYRYMLSVTWDETLQHVQFIGLNPSTADEFKDDPTLRRVKQFAKDWGYGGVIMTNLFAFRATKPEVMRRAEWPVSESTDGFRNDRVLKIAKNECALTVAAWGTKGGYLSRDEHVYRLIPGMKCLRLTDGGFPEHPLYVPASTQLIDFPL